MGIHVSQRRGLLFGAEAQGIVDALALLAEEVESHLRGDRPGSVGRPTEWLAVGAGDLPHGAIVGQPIGISIGTRQHASHLLALLFALRNVGRQTQPAKLPISASLGGARGEARTGQPFIAGNLGGVVRHADRVALLRLVLIHQRTAHARAAAPLGPQVRGQLALPHRCAPLRFAGHADHSTHRAGTGGPGADHGQAGGQSANGARVECAQRVAILVLAKAG